MAGISKIRSISAIEKGITLVIRPRNARTPDETYLLKKSAKLGEITAIRYITAESARIPYNIIKTRLNF
jgi:hypothetical protein